MFRIDHHIHTSRYSPDSDIDPFELLDRARAAGLQGIAITEHDCLWPEDELDELRARAEGLVVMGGVEISAYEGHFLVYGLTRLDEVGPGVSLARLLQVVGREGAAIVAAHPYRWEQDFDAIAEAHGRGLHGIELVSNNVTHLTRMRAELLLDREPFATTGSSDAHQPAVVGCYFSEFPTKILNLKQFRGALMRGEGRPGHRVGVPLTSGPVPSAVSRKPAAIGG